MQEAVNLEKTIHLSGISISGSAVYSSFNQVTLLRGGSPYFERLLTMINEAKEVIHLQVYIYDEDETGSQVSHALCEAAMRGVKVYLFLDGYSSKNLSSNFRKRMKENGIKIRWFQPLLKSKYFYFGRRLHHKVVVVDGKQALVGGINISNRYNDFPDAPAWLDWAIWVQGETAFALEKNCIQYWNKSRLGLGKTIRQPQRHYNNNHHPICYVRTRRNDWVAGKVEITRSYLEMMHRAQDEIIIMSSYFLPGSIIRNALAKAAKRGVKITLIISGISDVVLAKAAEKYWYPWIMRNQIRIFEYHRHILHGKISVYDRKWVTAGSYNVNNISAYASIELNLDVLNESFGNSTHEALYKIISEECKEITPQEFTRKTHKLALFWYWLNFEIYRLTLYLFTFYFKQKEKT
ncbi:MAG: phospholipase [Bacteroidetes bacterium]|nr:phospholipase [Bacteroidota bacterium]